MALTDDQKAMLRLLAQREQGYDDIAALTGQGVSAVRAKVKDAIAALDGPNPPADDQKAMLRLLAQREEGYGDIAALTGQDLEGVRSKVTAALDELEGSPAVAPTPPVQEEPPPKREPIPSPVAPEPAAVIPAPSPPKPPSDPPPALDQKSSSASKLKLPDDRGAVWGLGAGLAVILVLVILLASGALGGGGSSDSGSTSSSATETSATETSAAPQGGESTNAANELQPTQAVLKPVGASQASGRALFGRSKKQVVLLVKADGLEPSPQGKSYTVSLAKSPTERLPLVATQVSKSGKLEGTFQVAPQVLGLLASGFDEMEISLVSNGALGTALKAAKQSKKAPNYSGVTMLRGPITGAIVEAGEQGKVNP